MVDQASTRPLPLRFLDTWESAATSDFSLEKQRNLVKNLAKSSSFGLEVMRQMDALRRTTLMKQSGIAQFPSAEHLEQLESYLGHIRQLMQRADQTLEFKYMWSFPLSTKPWQQHKLSGMQLEQAMGSFVMGGAMRAAAYLTLAAAAGDAAAVPGEVVPPAAVVAASANPSGVLPEAATLLRKAAGLYAWLADELKQDLVSSSLPNPKPAELLPCTSECMRLLCLAEAQAVIAHRAAQKSSKASVTSQLYLAASDLFEQAAKVLKDNADNLKTISDTLRRFLAISAALQRCKAQQWWAEELRDQGEAGQGEGCCAEAVATLKECIMVAESNAGWKHALTTEMASIEGFRRRCEKDRITLTYQVVSKPQALPAGKVLATVIAYVPTKAVGGSLDMAMDE